MRDNVVARLYELLILLEISENNGHRSTSQNAIPLYHTNNRYGFLQINQVATNAAIEKTIPTLSIFIREGIGSFLNIWVM